jgi:hypothetical protein
MIAGPASQPSAPTAAEIAEADLRARRWLEALLRRGERARPRPGRQAEVPREAAAPPALSARKASGGARPKPRR